MLLSKRGYLADLLSGQGQHEQPAGVEDGGVQLGDVEAERRLLVGPGGLTGPRPVRLRDDHGDHLVQRVGATATAPGRLHYHDLRLELTAQARV
jgi:hypothetical protein